MRKRLVLKSDVRREYAKLRAEGHTAKNALAIAKYHCRMRASPFYKEYDGAKVKYKGHEYIVRLPYDDNGDKPWENCSPAGEVKEYRYSAAWGESTLPRGWVWLSKPDSRHWGYAYNYAQAVKAESEMCARQESERFRRWLNDDWHYVTVGLEHVKSGETEWVGGVEDDCPEYIAELLEEHAAELVQRLREQQHAADHRRAFL